MAFANVYLLILCMIGLFMTGGIFHNRLALLYLFYLLGLFICPQNSRKHFCNKIIVRIELFLWWLFFFFMLSLGNVKYDDGTLFFYDGGAQTTVLFGFTPLLQTRACLFSQSGHKYSDKKSKWKTRLRCVMVVGILLLMVTLPNGWLISRAEIERLHTVAMKDANDFYERSVFMSELFLVNAGLFLLLVRKKEVTWLIVSVCVILFFCIFTRMIVVPFGYSLFFGALYALALPEITKSVYLRLDSIAK